MMMIIGKNDDNYDDYSSKGQFQIFFVAVDKYYCFTDDDVDVADTSFGLNFYFYQRPTTSSDDKMKSFQLEF